MKNSSKGLRPEITTDVFPSTITELLALLRAVEEATVVSLEKVSSEWTGSVDEDRIRRAAPVVVTVTVSTCVRSAVIETPSESISLYLQNSLIKTKGTTSQKPIKAKF